MAILLVLLALAGGPALAAPETGLFWAIDGPSGRAGYLLGTIHSEDPRVLEYSAELLADLSASRVFAMELVPDQATLAQLTTYMRLPEGKRLQDLVGHERFARVSAALDAYGVPAAEVERMKPWAAMLTLSVPPPRSGLFMDFSLSLRASGAGLRVVGLESLEQQLAFLENMPATQQIQLLDHAVAEFDQVEEVHRQLVSTYLAGDLGRLQSLSRQQMQDLDPGLRDYFLREGIDARNRRMLGGLLPLLTSGPVFVAVGALHLPGETGLIGLLRAQGFTLTALASPFPPGVAGAAPAGSEASAAAGEELGHHQRQERGQ